MPPRWLSISIIVFWLATTGWLFYQDVWPLLLPGQAPPFTIALEDEVQTRQAHIRWIVSYNDHPYLRAETWVEPDPADDTFALHTHVFPQAVLAKEVDAGGGDPFGGLIVVRQMDSAYRVTRQGDLRSVSITFAGDAHVGDAIVPGEGQFTGEVRDGQLFSHLHASSPFPLLGGKELDADLKPVAVRAHGSVLSPLQPVNRIEGLRPGQTWRMTLVDPVQDAFNAMIQQALPGFVPDAGDLEARVMPQTQTLVWNNQPVECFVIEYRGDDVTAKTWVQVSTGHVLRQESERRGPPWESEPEGKPERLTLERE